MHHNGPIAGIAVHGNYVATAGYDNQIILWDAARHEPVARANHDHLVNQCAFNGAGDLLVSSSSDFSARIWEVPTLRLRAVLGGHDDDVDMAVFSPDDRKIATCALDRCVRVFDITGACKQTMRGHTGNVLAIAWNQEGDRIVSSSVDGTVREWDAETGAMVHVANLGVRSDSVVFDNEGSIWAGDDRGRIVNIRNGVPTYTQAHRAGVKKLVFAPSHRLMISLSYDRSLAVWIIDPAGTLAEIRRSTCPAAIWARAAAVMDTGRLAVGTFGKSYAIFDWLNGTWDLSKVEPGPGINAVLAVGHDVYTVGDAGVVAVNGKARANLGSLCNFIVPAGRTILTGGQLGKIFDVDTGIVLYEHHSPLNCGAYFERRGRPHVVIGTYTGELLVFAVENDGTLSLVTTLVVYENAVKSVVADEATIFSVCASTDIAWHDIEKLSLVRTRKNAHERIANACCVVGDSMFASVGRDRTLRIWSGQQEQAYATPHLNSVKCIAVSPERRILMTGSYGGTVASFDLETRQWRALRRPTAAGISCLAWSPGKNQFLAASYDGQIYPVQA